MEPKEMCKGVVVVGSGDMGSAVVAAMLRAALRPVVASRHPHRARTQLNGLRVRVASLEEALAEAEVVVVAIPAEHHHTLPQHLLKAKVVVDISNRHDDLPDGKKSLAEGLQEMLPQSHVVKALNTMSAYALRTGLTLGTKEVPVCGESEAARARVSGLVRELGLTPVDRGGLANARAIEDIPMAFFPEWRPAAITTALLLLASYIFLLLRRQICPNLEGEWDWDVFQYFPLKNSMLCFAMVATVLLLLCYVPGSLAGYIQLYRGTKYSLFPAWLDTWLKARKHFGVLALFFGAMHGCMALMTLTYEGMNTPALWSQHLYLALGVLLLGSMAVLGVTSLPGVAMSLSWREFSALHRSLGWGCVLLLSGHAFFKGYRKFLQNRFQCMVLPHESQVMIVLCLATVVLQLPLWCPGVRGHLARIRRGYERRPAGSPA